MALNELNCTGPGWVEVINPGQAEVSLANWLLTDGSHEVRLPSDTLLGPGTQLVVDQAAGGAPLPVSCDGTLRLEDAGGALVDTVALPGPATAGTTYGRIPDGAGAWTPTVPTPGMANAVPTDGQNADPAWLYDPLQVTEIDLEATDASLVQLNAVPDDYVDARVTLRHGADTYGPYRVGLKLKGHGTFRQLDGKAAFKVKFAYAVAGQKFRGLKALTLNNMVQDGSMIAEATSSLLFAATGVPSARVGYAYVRINGVEYGLYADVETVDSVMARRLFSGTQHIYKADYANDVVPGRTGEFEVEEGSSTDRTDLETLATAAAAGADGWWERMQPVADLAEMTRAWAAEHYAGHWDGYSVAAIWTVPNNYYLHGDLTGRFSLLTSGTDQTWLEHTPFGVYGKGVLMRQCVQDATCRQLYIDALHQIAANPTLAALGQRAREIQAAIAPWRARDPRREQTVAVGEAEADAKVATMSARPAELAAWLASPSFFEAATDVADNGGNSPAPEATAPETAPAPVEAPPAAVLPNPPSPPRTMVPRLGTPVVTPAKPTAGKRFSLFLRVTRSDTGAALVSAKLFCAPSVAGQTIRHSESFKAGTVRLSFTVPKAAKGKLLKIAIRVNAAGRTATHTYTYRVR